METPWTFIRRCLKVRVFHLRMRETEVCNGKLDSFTADSLEELSSLD